MTNGKTPGGTPAELAGAVPLNDLSTGTVTESWNRLVEAGFVGARSSGSQHEIDEHRDGLNLGILLITHRVTLRGRVATGGPWPASPRCQPARSSRSPIRHVA